MKIKIVLLLVIVCMAGVWGCRRAQEKGQAQGPKKVGVTFSSLPADFPADVYIDKKSEIVLAQENPEEAVVTLIDRRTPKAAIEDYKSKMKEKQWVLSSEVNLAGMSRALFLKGDREADVVALRGKKDRESSVSVRVRESKAQ